MVDCTRRLNKWGEYFIQICEHSLNNNEAPTYSFIIKLVAVFGNIF